MTFRHGSPENDSLSRLHSRKPCVVAPGTTLIPRDVISLYNTIQRYNSAAILVSATIRSISATIRLVSAMMLLVSTIMLYLHMLWCIHVLCGDEYSWREQVNIYLLVLLTHIVGSLFISVFISIFITIFIIWLSCVRAGVRTGLVPLLPRLLLVLRRGASPHPAP